MKKLNPITILILISFFIGENLFASLNTTKEADTFWGHFRKIFLAKDLDKISTRTQFPLIIKGTMDEDPTFKMSGTNFKKCFVHLFEKDTGLSSTPQNHLDYVKNQFEFSKKLNPLAASTFRVGDMVFEKIENDFKLTTIYLETSEKEIIRDCKE